MNEYIEKVLNEVKVKNEHEKEFIQAVGEVYGALEPVINIHPEFEKHAILERMCEPERFIMFRVPWIDDKGNIVINRGYRLQFSIRA